MTQEIDLNNIDLWRTELGLLPVPLYPGRVHGPQPYVMMNGSRGNFCLAADGVDAGVDPRSIAWSSNVSHFVSMQGEYVEVQRWDQRKSGTERYTSNSVRQNLNKFHEYLERDAVTQDVSIVLHAIRIFRRLRAAVGSSHDGPAALNAYLVLLACTTDNVDRDGLVADYWRLAPGAREVASTISDVTWNSLRDELLHGRKVDKLEAYLKLLLRHAAGQLFQEAHYEAVFMPSIQQELELPGITPAPVGINKQT
jgi:adenine-specific DNA-methyltransferase